MSLFRPTRLLMAAIAILAVSSAANAESTTARPPIFQKMIDCRAITDQVRRLACFDETVGAFDAAEKLKDVVVADRDQMKKAKRGLFGLTLPRLALLGNSDGDDKDEESSRIEAKISSAYQLPTARWVIVIEDGAKWVQIDERTLSVPAKRGQIIKIRRASFGSYFANVNGQIAIRMRREN